MPEMDLEQPRFKFGACGPFTKNKEKTNLKKQDILDTFIKMNWIEHVFINCRVYYK